MAMLSLKTRVFRPKLYHVAEVPYNIDIKLEEFGAQVIHVVKWSQEQFKYFKTKMDKMEA